MTETDFAAAAHPAAAGAGGGPESATAVLEAHEITVRWGGAVAVDKCSLRLHAGEAVCVLGRNGAGKTSWLSAIAGVAPSTGQIWPEPNRLPSDWAMWIGLLVNDMSTTPADAQICQATSTITTPSVP